MSIAFWGPIPLSWSGMGGPAPTQNISRKSSINYHDHKIALSFPLTEWTGYELRTVRLTCHLWYPYTINPTLAYAALAQLMDLHVPMPLFINGALQGRGGGLFTLRGINETWEVHGIKAKFELEFTEYMPVVSGNQFLAIASTALSLIPGMSGAAGLVGGLSAVGSIGSALGGAGGLLSGVSGVVSGISSAVSTVTGTLATVAGQISGGITNSIFSGGGLGGLIPAGVAALSGGPGVAIGSLVNNAVGVIASSSIASVAGDVASSVSNSLGAAGQAFHFDITNGAGVFNAVGDAVHAAVENTIGRVT
jgi:hypothetical protein